MQRCAFCEKSLPDNARFCPRCGHNLDATTIVKRKTGTPSMEGQSLDISNTPTRSLTHHKQEEEQAQGNNPAVSTLVEEQPTQTLQDTDKEDEGLPPVQGVSEKREREPEVSAP